MTDKNFFLDKIKANAPTVYDFALKHYDQIKIEAAGRNLDRTEFCLRINKELFLTREMLGELMQIESFEFIYVSGYALNIQFKVEKKEP